MLWKSQTTTNRFHPHHLNIQISRTICASWNLIEQQTHGEVFGTAICRSDSEIWLQIITSFAEIGSLVLSGWDCSANLRYACLISRSEAALETLRILYGSIAKKIQSKKSTVKIIQTLKSQLYWHFDTSTLLGCSVEQGYYSCLAWKNWTPMGTSWCDFAQFHALHLALPLPSLSKSVRNGHFTECHLFQCSLGRVPGCWNTMKMYRWRPVPAGGAGPM